MKCPHCGIYYMDDERECPVCGKRPGILTPNKKQVSHTTKLEKKKPPVQPAWQRTAASQQKKKKSSPSIGCLTIIIFIVIINIAAGIVGLFMNRTSHFISREPEPEYNDSAEISCELLEIFPAGTWVNTDGTITMTIDSSGTLSWTDGIYTAVDNYPLCSRLELTEDNAEEYCSEQELQLYPIAEYTRYTLYAWDNDNDLNICIYIPIESSLYNGITEFDYYDYLNDTFQTFRHVSDVQDNII